MSLFTVLKEAMGIFATPWGFMKSDLVLLVSTEGGEWVRARAPWDAAVVKPPSADSVHTTVGALPPNRSGDSGWGWG